ncbi:MAG: hypothetical protein HKN47_28985 [Pirellulaceae bacterium]|nr:hypothetical protein [Pirellulaceae bacterium]
MPSITKWLCLIAILAGTSVEIAQAQRRPNRSDARGGPSRGTEGGRRSGSPTPNSDPTATVSPLPVGESGIAWYSTWETASKEAIRSNRPILFISAASQCGGVPGVF